MKKFNQSASSKITFIFTISITTICLITLFSPLFFLDKILFTDGYEQFAPEKIYFISYNPINPEIYYYLQDGENEFLVVYAYLTRDGIFSYSGLDFADYYNNQSSERQNYTSFRIKDINESELKEILQNNNLTKNVPEGLNYTRQDFSKEQEMIWEEKLDEVDRLIKAEQDLPLECNLFDSSRVLSPTKLAQYKIDDLLNLNRDIIDKDLKDNFNYNQGDSFSIRLPDSNNIRNTMIKILDPNYPNIKLVQLYFGNMQPNTMIQPEDKLNKIYLVTKDCNRVQVPANPDGTFDFESALRDTNK
jgi:hypothetical protein